VDGYVIVVLDRVASNARPVCDACAFKFAPELLTARSVADNVDSMLTKLDRQGEKHEKIEQPMVHLRQAMGDLTDNLMDRKVLPWSYFPVNSSTLMQEMEEIARRIPNDLKLRNAILGVAYRTPDDMAAMWEGEDFYISVTLPPWDDGHSAEARTRSVAELVSQELMFVGVPFEWDGGPRIRVIGTKSAAVASLC